MQVDVWVLSFEAPGSAAAEFGRMFDMSAPMAHKLVSSAPFALQKGVDLKKAETLSTALQHIGARVELRRADGSVHEFVAPDRESTPAPRAAPPRAKRASVSDASQPGSEAWEKPALRKSEIPAALEGKPSLSARPPARTADVVTKDAKPKKKVGNSAGEKRLATVLAVVMVFAVVGVVLWALAPEEAAFSNTVAQVDDLATSLTAGQDHYDPREWLAEGNRVIGCSAAVATALLDAVEAAGATEQRFAGYARLRGEPHVRTLVITLPSSGTAAIETAAEEALDVEGSCEAAWLEKGTRYFIVHFDG